MTTSPNDRLTNLIWIDLEMTGLCTQTDSIIEIATIVTDKHLNELAEGPVLAIKQSRETMDEMDDWNTRQHRESGPTEFSKAKSTHARQKPRRSGFCASGLMQGLHPCVATVSARTDDSWRARCP